MLPAAKFCVLKRSLTNTPLQALVVLNDPVYLEAAAALAEPSRSGSETDDYTPGAGEPRIMRLCLSRQPVEAEVAERHRRALRKRNWPTISENPAAGRAVCWHRSKPTHAVETDTEDAPELAAWTIISSMLLNLDETLTKG